MILCGGCSDVATCVTWVSGTHAGRCDFCCNHCPGNLCVPVFNKTTGHAIHIDELGVMWLSKAANSLELMAQDSLCTQCFEYSAPMVINGHPTCRRCGFISHPSLSKLKDSTLELLAGFRRQRVYEMWLKGKLLESGAFGEGTLNIFSKQLRRNTARFRRTTLAVYREHHPRPNLER